jgi:hypothetical protein
MRLHPMMSPYKKNLPLTQNHPPMMRLHQMWLPYKKDLPQVQNPPPGKLPKSDPETRFLLKPGFLSAYATRFDC